MDKRIAQTINPIQTRLFCVCVCVGGGGGGGGLGVKRIRSIS